MVMNHAMQIIQNETYSQQVLQLLPVAETLSVGQTMSVFSIWQTERLLNLYPGIKRSARRVLACVILLSISSWIDVRS